MVEHLRRGTTGDFDAIVTLQRAAYARNRDLLGVEPLPLLADYQAILLDANKDVRYWRADLGTAHR
jgi:hypothetical protein